MSEIVDALRSAENKRNRSFSARIGRLLARRSAPRSAVLLPVPQAPAPQAPAAPAPSRDGDADLKSLRSALERIDDRLSHEMSERDTKLRDELHRDMMRLETELSERFAASVHESRRMFRRMVAVVVLAAACLGALSVVVLALR